MDTKETITRRLADMTRKDVIALLRLIDFFEFAGLWNESLAKTWRQAARFRAAELSVPPALA